MFISLSLGVSVCQHGGGGGAPTRSHNIPTTGPMFFSGGIPSPSHNTFTGIMSFFGGTPVPDREDTLEQDGVPLTSRT